MKLDSALGNFIVISILRDCLALAISDQPVDVFVVGCSVSSLLRPLPNHLYQHIRRPKDPLHHDEERRGEVIVEDDVWSRIDGYTST